MTEHVESRLVGLPPEQVFDLVADVERYPEFLTPWQRAVICQRDGDGYQTEQTVGFGLLTRQFHTLTRLERPHRIVVTSHDDVFSRFCIRWDFTPADGGCRIDFTLDCTVESWLLAPAFEMMLAPTAASMVSAFERRARDLAGAALH